MKYLQSTFLIFVLFILPASAETGYELWLRYNKIQNPELLNSYLGQIKAFNVIGTSATHDVIKNELSLGLSGLLGQPFVPSTNDDASLLAGLSGEPSIAKYLSESELKQIGEEGYLVKSVSQKEKSRFLITAKDPAGLLYGTFHFLKLLQTHQNLASINVLENPKVDIRILNHWDNLDRTSERGYAGFSIWDWHKLPDYLDQRYIDYARANASIGLNATVLTNVNANALVLTPAYLEKVKALADLFRPYGIKVYLTARFSAPIEIGGLDTADPLNKEVIKWWEEKVQEIYRYIPDFGGFLVKANSEGQPGPQNYSRSHAEGANMMADALKPFGGVVMWRAFVYSSEEPDDRAKQAYTEFNPLDGTFRSNVLVQVKNGAIDFQPREPFHPLFGAMPKTPVMMEFQITQEYLGQATQLVYLAPMWKECLDADTYVNGKGSTVSKVIDGSLHDYSITGIAGVANTGTDINWTGHPFAQANWYAFGLLAWNPEQTADQIAEDWIRMSYSNDPKTIATIKDMMMNSWEASVNYMTPLGLHHLMGTGHHYGPAPWVSNLSRADWTPVYYHKADAFGVGFDRSESGSNAVSQYSPEVAKIFNSKDKIPEKFLLWFHHVSWGFEMNSGRTLWNELAFRYQDGVNAVRKMQGQWQSIKPQIDENRYRSVQMLLDIQEKEAIWWKDASLSYFQTFSKQPLPDAVEPPTKSLEYYQSLKFPFAPGIRPSW
ncbi:MAG: alpha-glucuronidase family glycosyl hydrolase [Marinoscillum sp.]|uniref:alpha-glucuronidase family glycosyl hydrolase n=2 Tax=Marinoscillum sp. TaxID=2024838 RepID=UPI0032F3678A